jgi:16S rRNA (cytosine1402-N4)-methyltransferase
MLKETIDYLNLKAGGTYVDCTLGGGGHTKNIKLQTSFGPSYVNDLRTRSNLKIIGFDQDKEALAAAKETLARFDNIVYVNDNFANLKKHVTEKVDGVLFDLGVSSSQIDQPRRGFSVQNDGPLDMRMDQGQKLTAAEIINNYSEEQLIKIFFEYGEEKFSKRIAKAIRLATGNRRLATTAELKEIIEQAIPTWKKRESVTRIFQALRIAVNNELAVLKSALTDAIDLLKPGGRIVVLAYHSLEDRIVKQTFRQATELKILTKKPITASAAELSFNPRSKSAKLRAAEKI